VPVEHAAGGSARSCYLGSWHVPLYVQYFAVVAATAVPCWPCSICDAAAVTDVGSRAAESKVQ
jgi:hypothetical protein